ncbi:riboflavin kinase [Bacillus xiapuensis]|uniref:riboflavin kinase n=1 Tax=Bacillus xiapuensis TaxID=2014075 RepID=A0ABU6NGP6_9BACI|nr:riboflavin kinase [Bacillus xiapuensis]
MEWHQYLRKEQKFSGIEELIAQIERDKQNAVNYFKKFDKVSENCSESTSFLH